MASCHIQLKPSACLLSLWLTFFWMWIVNSSVLWKWHSSVAFLSNFCNSSERKKGNVEVQICTLRSGHSNHRLYRFSDGRYSLSSLFENIFSWVSFLHIPPYQKHQDFECNLSTAYIQKYKNWFVHEIKVNIQVNWRRRYSICLPCARIRIANQF